MKLKLENPNSSLSLEKFDMNDAKVSEKFIKALRKFNQHETKESMSKKVFVLEQLKKLANF